MIIFACPRCKSLSCAQEHHAGTKRACPSCGQRLQVPPHTPRPPANKTVLAEPVPEKKTILASSVELTPPSGHGHAAPREAAPMPRPRAAEVGDGVIVGAYFVGAAIPVIGWVMAIYLLARSRAGHAMGVAALSIVMFVVWLGLLTGQAPAGAWAVPARSTPSEVARILGSWETKWFVDGIRLTTVYTFQADGTLLETTTNDFGQLISGHGRYSYVDGQVTVSWSSGSVERASLTFLSGDQFRYHIVSHTGDPRQVGLVLSYRRLAP